MQKTLKLKGADLFTKQQWTTVRLVVKVVNKIVMKASMLAKVYYLSTNQPTELDIEFYKDCIKVVTGQSLQLRKQTSDDMKTLKHNIFVQLQNQYQTYFGNNFVNTYNLSISQILGFAASTLETCMLNNIEFHYVQHVNKYMYTHLYKIVTDDKKLIAQTRSHILTNTECPALLQQWANEHRNIVCPNINNDFYTDLKERPWVYHKHMVLMSQTLEQRYPRTKLLSPFVIRRSYIPKHITIDTNALVQLLMDDIKGFVAWYNIEYNIKPNIKTKADLGSSFKKVFGREPITDIEDFTYQQSFWKYLLKWDTFKQVLKDKERELYFGNSIMTDGCSISFSVVSNRAKKNYKGRTRKKKATQDEFLHDIQYDENTLYLGCDPGKGDLVTITDGCNMFKYTKGKRNKDTKGSYFTKRNLNKRSKDIIEGEYQTNDIVLSNYYPRDDNLVLSQYEERVLSLHSSKSCNLETFGKWIQAKFYKEEQVTRVYEHPSFRNDQFTKYCLKKRSEDKMLNDLESFIQTRKKTLVAKDDVITKNISKDTSNVVILYGNWGRNPNLKNNAPTPGIGLRRKIHNRIPTMTVCEHYTSQTCPCCKTINLKKAILQDCKVPKRHHLLRCQNEMCSSRWWNRNVAGSYNILYKGLRDL